MRMVLPSKRRPYVARAPAPVKTRLRERCYAAWVCILLTVLGCGPAAAAPHRVVSTFLCTDEYVFRLVPHKDIAALSYLAGDTHPVVSTIARQLHHIPLIRPSAETIVALKPDLVVMYQNTDARLHTQLRAAGIRILDVPWANSLADIRKVTRFLGEQLDAKAKAAALITRMDRELDWARRNSAPGLVRTLIYQPNGYSSAGHFTEEIMQAAGLVDFAPALATTRLGQIPVEAVVASPPDLLILSGNREARSSRADFVLHHPAFKALGSKSVIAWASLTPLLCPGPWSANEARPFTQFGRRAHLLARKRAGN
jgi:iron complex transport system substrate-binding protein